MRLVRATGLGIATAATLAAAAPALANNRIVLETVSDYTFISGGSTINNTDANTEGSGFWTPMTAAGTPWTAGVWWKDNLVYDTDFFDPQITGNSFDNDTGNFDQSTAGLSFFIGHGQCSDVTNTACTSNAQCGANGYCPSFPLAAGQQAACINQSARSIITSSSNSQHGNFVNYGAGTQSMAFGEDAASGSFGGVGTNGGTNVVIITNSCGFRSHYLWPTNFNQPRFYSGVHQIQFNMPVGNIKGTSSSNFADTSQWSARGSTLANLILTNTNAPAKNAWLTPSFTNNNYFGSGANVVGSFNSSSSVAQSRLNTETWANTTSESYDATSGNGGYYYWTCNFSNCSSFTL
jgi:hypothetical protein